MHNLFLAAGFVALVSAQSQVIEAPPPPAVLLSTTKSGVLPIIPTATDTPFIGVDTLQGAIISPLPPNPNYTAINGPAPSQLNQPPTTYLATLPPTMFNPLFGPPVNGSIKAIGSPTGVQFTLNLTNLPSQSAYGPFNWHIHTRPVPSDGNCTATLSHFDPQNAGELYMCNASLPQNCQVGDLAGKHGGKITSPGNFTTSFVDAYLSTEELSSAFFGGLAFVLHSSNATRITCANFVLQSGGAEMGNATATATAGSPEFTGAAGRVGARLVAALVAGVGAIIL